MKLLLAAMFLAHACTVVDALDGHIDDVDHCCAALTKQRIRECMVSFQTDDGDQCWTAHCVQPVGRVVAYLAPDGEIFDTCPFDK